MFSVEYRLLQHAPFPAVVMDAAAVYAHVVEKYSTLISLKKCKIILVGDSSGGNLVLALARWIRDEGHLPMPNGLLLLSVRGFILFSMAILTLFLPAIIRPLSQSSGNLILFHSSPK